MLRVEDLDGKPGGSPADPHALARARETLARALSWLGSTPVFERSSRRPIEPSSSREDLVQFVALAALTKIEQRYLATGGVPDWCQPEDRLRAYLRGMLGRTVLRMRRDARAAREVTLPLEWLVHERARTRLEREEELDHARACLRAFTADELRLFVRFGSGCSYLELAREAGSSPGALAKRRARALERLRARCRCCSWRIQNGCAWLPRGWLGTPGSSPALGTPGSSPALGTPGSSPAPGQATLQRGTPAWPAGARAPAHSLALRST